MHANALTSLFVSNIFMSNYFQNEVFQIKTEEQTYGWTFTTWSKSCLL